MSLIMPSGKQGINWSPTDITRTASTGGVESDPLAEAAKKFLAKKAQVAVDDTFGGKGTEVVEETGKADGAAGATGVADASDTAKDAVEKAQVAVTEVQVALDEVAAKVGGGNPTDTADETVEVELDEEPAEEVEIEIEEDEEKEEKSEDSPCKDKCEEKEHKCMDKCEDGKDEKSANPFVKKEGEEEEEDKKVEASVSLNGFVRVADISPKTKKKIYDYWTKDLQYDKEFAKLMITDYEKK